MSPLTDMTSPEKLARVRQLQRGDTRIQPRCTHCGSPGIQQDLDFGSRVVCIACGRYTAAEILHRERIGRMSRFIETGEL